MTKGKKKSSAEKAKTAKPKKASEISLIHLIPCDHVWRDPASGKVSIHGIFDRLLPDSVPKVIAFSVFAKLAGVGEHDVSIEFCRPDGSCYMMSHSKVVIPEGQYAGIQAIVGSLELKQFGRHEIRVMSGGEIVGSPCPIEVLSGK